MDAIYQGYLEAKINYAIPASLPNTAVVLSDPKQKTGQYSYLNERSQGALICETKGFPGYYDEAISSHRLAYSDRMHGWDSDRFNELCKLAGGDQGWAYSLPKFSDTALKEFAKLALDLPNMPDHVRVVHHFNVSNGGSCPTVEAIYRTKEKAGE